MSVHWWFVLRKKSAVLPQTSSKRDAKKANSCGGRMRPKVWWEADDGWMCGREGVARGIYTGTTAAVVVQVQEICFSNASPSPKEREQEAVTTNIHGSGNILLLSFENPPPTDVCSSIQ